MKIDLEICVLAAGKGTRMKTSVPKMLQTVAGRPLIEHVISTAKQLSPQPSIWWLAKTQAQCERYLPSKQI